MILTLSEYKTLPFYKSTQSEAQISELLPEIELAYLEIRGIPFFMFTGDLTVDSAVIDDISNFDEIKVGQRIYGTNVYGKITAIDTDTDDDSNLSDNITLDDDATATEDDAELTIYPIGSKLVSAKMLAYVLNSSDFSNKKSEKIGDYAYTAFEESDMINGFPRTIVGSIKRYADVI